MELTAAEGRVLGCLIAQQALRPEPHALSLDEVRFACNQGDRPDAEAFDDRTVDDALLALKSKGLARFVQVARNVGPVHYRHRADERWRLGAAELAVLAVLLLGGPQTVAEVRAAVRDHPALAAEPEVDVEAALDALAGRTPTPFATRIAPPSWGGETLWAEVLTGWPSSEDLYRRYERHPGTTATPDRPGEPAVSRLPTSERPTTLREVADRLTSIERRLAGIEAAIATLTERSSTTHESSRMIR